MPAPDPPPDQPTGTDWEARLAQWAAEVELAERLDSDRWVTLARAEALSGASRSTLRSWYRSARVRSRLVDGPHGPQRLVSARDVLDAATGSPQLRRRGGREAVTEARLAAVADRLGSLAAGLADVSERLAVLEARMGRTRGAAPPPAAPERPLRRRRGD